MCYLLIGFCISFGIFRFTIEVHFHPIKASVCDIRKDPRGGGRCHAKLNSHLYSICATCITKSDPIALYSVIHNTIALYFVIQNKILHHMTTTFTTLFLISKPSTEKSNHFDDRKRPFSLNTLACHSTRSSHLHFDLFPITQDHPLRR